MINEGEEETEAQKTEEPAMPALSDISGGDMADVTSNVYPGPLGIWKNTNLTDAEQRIEQTFAEQLQSDVTYWMREYLRRNERLLDTDLARALSAEWNFNNESRALLTSAVHNPASAFINALYEELLKQSTSVDNDAILFTAGGGGSGKTTAIQERLAAQLDRVYLTYDTTLSKFESAQAKIETALVAGKNVQVIFVHRPFETAVRGVIDRAISKGGRTVPLNVLAGDHYGASKTVLQVAAAYSQIPKVQVYAVDNSKASVAQARVFKGEPMLKFLEEIAYTDIGILQRQAEKVLYDEIDIRRASVQNIPQYIIEALLRTYVRGTR